MCIMYMYTNKDKMVYINEHTFILCQVYWSKIIHECEKHIIKCATKSEKNALGFSCRIFCEIILCAVFYIKDVVCGCMCHRKMSSLQYAVVGCIAFGIVFWRTKR